MVFVTGSRNGCDRLEHALAALDPPSRRAMEMFLTGLSTLQIANELGLTETATASLLTRLVLEVRDHLDG